MTRSGWQRARNWLRGRQRRGWLRLRPRLVVTVAALPMLLAVFGLATAAPAEAFSIPNPFASCAHPPGAQLPGTGLSGWLGSGARPAGGVGGGNPFSSHPTATEFQQYGYAGLAWSTYDLPTVAGGLGCVPDPGTAFFAEIDTTTGNVLMGAAKSIVAIDNTVHNWAANSSWLSALNPVVTTSEAVLYRSMFLVWAGITVMVIALTIMGRAHRGDFAGALTTGGWALFVLALVGFGAAHPLLPGQYASSAMSSTIGSMDAGFTGQSSKQAVVTAHSSLMVSAILYPGWVEGEFGSASSPTARTYGPQLFKAQALTWSQAAGSPQQVQAVEKADAGQWQKAAGQVKSTNPAAYPYLQGTEFIRAGVGLQTLITALIVCGFDIFCSLVVVVAMAMVLMAVVAFPVLAVFGLHHGASHYVTGLGSQVGGMMVSAVLYAAAAGIDAKAAQVLLARNANGPSLMPIFVLLILPIALFIIVRKIRAGHVLPRPFLAAAGLIGMNRMLRSGVAAGTAAGINNSWQFRQQNLTVINAYAFPGGGGGPGGGGWSGNQVPPPSGSIGGGGGGALPPPGGGSGGGGQPPPGGGSGGGGQPPPGGGSGGGALPPPGGGSGGGGQPPPGGGSGGGGQPPPGGGSGGGGQPPPGGGSGGGGSGGGPPWRQGPPPSSADGGHREYGSGPPQPRPGAGKVIPLRRTGTENGTPVHTYDGGAGANRGGTSGTGNT